MRIKRGIMHLKRRKNLLRQTKGYMWGRKSKIKLARVAMLKAGVHAYRDRRRKKREFRKLWSIQINAAVREHNLNYSKFIFGLKKAKIALDRKMLANLAENNPEVFAEVVKATK